MKDFVYYAPTEVVFGRNSEEKIGCKVKQYGGTKVLLHYGSGSVLRSGLLDVVKSSLEAEGITYVELGGVVPNPRLSLVYKGIDLCRAEGVDFILAVGGGSVIDSAKAIAWGVPYEGDVWDFYMRKARAEACLPLGAVLTIPAAGSEMSDGSVITNEDGWLKKDYCHNNARCRFAIMNPARTFSLPAYQTACGVTDMIMHIFERYFTHDDDMEVTNGLCESLLRSIMEYAPVALASPDDYDARAQIMWAGSLAHNGLTGCGYTEDWATHYLEHELSGMFDVAHGAGLAAVWGAWARYTVEENAARFARFGVNVLGVKPDFHDIEETALDAIAVMEDYLESIGMPTSIPQLLGRKATDEEIATMSLKASRGGNGTIGSLKVLNRNDMEAIYRMANVE